MSSKADKKKKKIQHDEMSSSAGADAYRSGLPGYGQEPTRIREQVPHPQPGPSWHCEEQSFSSPSFDFLDLSRSSWYSDVDNIVPSIGNLPQQQHEADASVEHSRDSNPGRSGYSQHLPPPWSSPSYGVGSYHGLAFPQMLEEGFSGSSGAFVDPSSGAVGGEPSTSHGPALTKKGEQRKRQPKQYRVDLGEEKFMERQKQLDCERQRKIREKKKKSKKQAESDT